MIKKHHKDQIERAWNLVQFRINRVYTRGAEYPPTAIYIMSLVYEYKMLVYIMYQVLPGPRYKSFANTLKVGWWRWHFVSLTCSRFDPRIFRLIVLLLVSLSDQPRKKLKEKGSRSFTLVQVH